MVSKITIGYNVCFSNVNLCYSRENRPVPIITITSFSKKKKDRLDLNDSAIFPNSDAPFSFSSSKPVIFISARVHPG